MVPKGDSARRGRRCRITMAGVLMHAITQRDGRCASYDLHAFEERVETLIEAEASARRDRKVARLVRDARTKSPSARVGEITCLARRKVGASRTALLFECEGGEVALGQQGRRPAGVHEPGRLDHAQRRAPPRRDLVRRARRGRGEPYTLSVGRWGAS